MKQLFIVLAFLGAYPFHVAAQDLTKPAKNNPQKQRQTNGNYGEKPKNKARANRYESLIDTVILSSDGSSIRYFAYSSSSNFDSDTLNTGTFSPFSSIAPSGVRRNFEQKQQQILQQVDEDALRFNRWMEQQRAAHYEQLRQQWKAQKVALFIEVMGLTPEESERFWPIYNEFSNKKDEIMRKRQDISNQLRQVNLSIDDKQAEALSKEYVNSLTQEADLQQEYFKKYKTILKPNKLLMIYKAEDAFKLMMLQNRMQ